MSLDDYIISGQFFRHGAPGARRNYGDDLSTPGELPTQPAPMTGLATVVYLATVPRQSWPVLGQDCRRCRHMDTCYAAVFQVRITVCEAAAILKGRLAPYEPPPPHGQAGYHQYKRPKL